MIADRAGCLEDIPKRQEQVLTLRTGIFNNRSYTRGEVARMLRVSLAQEGQIEHRAVSSLRDASKNGCPPLGAAARSGIVAAAGELSQVERGLGGTLAAPAAPAVVRHLRGRTKPRHTPTGSVSAVSTHVQRGGIGPPPPSGPGTTLWLLIAAALLAATAVATPVARRRMRPHEAPVAVGAAPAAAVADAQLEREGDAAALTNLGVLLEQRGDLDGAIAAYRRADERGDANGSFNLGVLLAERGDLRGALSALHRADERGDPAGASNLGVLLEQQGDVAGAVAAYRRADARGDANGSFNLGLLLAGRGDLAGARRAYRRAVERGDLAVGERARAALKELNGQDEA